jgi:hypothetical protein
MINCFKYVRSVTAFSPIVSFLASSLSSDESGVVRVRDGATSSMYCSAGVERGAFDFPRGLQMLGTFRVPTSYDPFFSQCPKLTEEILRQGTS